MTEPTTKAGRTHRAPVPQALTMEPPPENEFTPLGWLLWVVNDPRASDSRRDRAAIAAAPYCHVKPMAVGKKARQAKAAKAAGAGTDWADDLGFDDDERPPRQ